MPLVRRLNGAGIARLAEFLDSQRTDTPQGVPNAILSHGATSEPIGVNVEIELQSFGTRFKAAQYLNERFMAGGLQDVERDVGLWAWLALFYFNELCPADQRGRRDPGEYARYILEPMKAWRYYKHLLAGPFLIFHAHRDNPRRALALLYGPVHSLSQFVDQLASRQEIVTNKALLQGITDLYMDSDSGQPKRGARTTGPGGPRRLATVLNQLDVTWDLYAISTESFLQCLPSEFDRFKVDICANRSLQQ
jgi:hypothetical protein